MKVTKGIEVEECHNCSAPDPAGILYEESAGPNRDKSFRLCRTCWTSSTATAPMLYPRQYTGDTSVIVQVMCNIEQKRRLREGWYDEPDRHTRLKLEIMNDAVEFLDRHPKQKNLDPVEQRGFDYAVNQLRIAVDRVARGET
jgi:hypothetical protein